MSATAVKERRASPVKPRRSSRRRRITLLLCLLPVAYLLLTGPALWSRSLIDHDGWKRGVVYYVAPVMWLDHQFRDRTLVERVGLIDLGRAPHTRGYRWLEGYWSLFGSRTLTEADRVALLLKFKF